MASIERASFSTVLTANVQLIPPTALISIIGYATLTSVLNVIRWQYKWPAIQMGMWVIGPYALLATAVQYLAITGILRVNRSHEAYLKFLGTTALLLVPAALVLAIMYAYPLIGGLTALFLVAAVGMAAFLIMTLLPAWPVAQALSPSIVSPIRVLMATRGCRLGLIFVALLLFGLNTQKLIPTVEDARDLTHAVVFAAGHTVISAITMMFTAAVAATAFVFAVRNDRGLAGR